jgi:AraC-like DNA-binding protein
LLFHPDQSYRIIHPNDDGDDCVAGLDAVCAGPTSPACAPFVRWPRTMLSNGKNRRSCAVTGDEHRSADAARIEAIRERLAADLFAKHSLATLARAAALSPFYLARLFRAHTGSSLHRYLLELRLATAHARLRDGATNVTHSLPSTSVSRA